MAIEPAEMTGEDFHWAARLMEQRRVRYEEFSPVFWRPAKAVTDRHARFLEKAAARDGAVALRTDHAFVISDPSDGRCLVDDFAVEAEQYWPTEGQSLLLAAWAEAQSPQQQFLRVVTARQDTPKRTMLMTLGLKVTARWWVKELTPHRVEVSFGPIKLDRVDALLVPAPPVYDPGGPVCLLGDIDADAAAELSDYAQEHGAVLAVVQRDRSPAEAPPSEPELERAGFHNPSEFFEGRPTPMS